jgi:hypothetical protein
MNTDTSVFKLRDWYDCCSTWNRVMFIEFKFEIFCDRFLDSIFHVFFNEQKKYFLIYLWSFLFINWNWYLTDTYILIHFHDNASLIITDEFIFNYVFLRSLIHVFKDFGFSNKKYSNKIIKTCIMNEKFKHKIFYKEGNV